MEPEFTWHAAQRILERGIDGQAVLERARAAMAAGFGQDRTARIQLGKLIILLNGNQIITVFELEAKPIRPRRRKREKAPGFWKPAKPLDEEE